MKEHLNGNTNSTLEKNYTITDAAIATFTPYKHFSFLLGAGCEFAKNENMDAK